MAVRANGALRVSGDLTLPLSAVTETFSILGQRGSGKTSTAVVLAEEMLAQRQRVAIVDPLGVWWGLRSSADGKQDGYPVVIFGGDHADLPLEPGAGELIANLLVDKHVACVIDLSHMRKAEQRTFMTAFTETLYHRNRDPIHLIVDEADLYAGQRPPKGSERLLGAMEDLVRRGRARGIGLTLISQRPAVLHKDVLSQTSALVALRLVSPQDSAALDAWISQHDIAGVRKEVLNSLPSLPVGTAWVWSPGAFDIFAKVPIRKRSTYDSSATPKVGGVRVVPDRYASVDLESLGAQMADLVERKRESDPNVLRRRVTQLEGALAKAERSQSAVTERVVEKVVTVEVEKQVVSEKATAELVACANEMRQVARTLIERADSIVATLGERPAPPAVVEVAAPRQQRAPRLARPAVDRPIAPPVRVVESSAKEGDQAAYDSLRAGAKRIMEALARFYPNSLSKPQIGALSQMRHSSGTFSTYLGELRRGGFVDADGRDRLVCTLAGMAVVGAVPPRPTNYDELYRLWNERLRAGTMKMLDVVMEAAPEAVSKQEIADGAGLSVTSGTFSTYLGELRRFALVRQDPDGFVLGDAWAMIDS